MKTKMLVHILILLLLTSCIGMGEQLVDSATHDRGDEFCPGNRNSDGVCRGVASSDSDDEDQDDEESSVLSWDFSTASDYTYDSNYVEITSNQAKLKTVDINFSGSDFSSGSHVGSELNSDNLSILSSDTSNSLRVDSILSGHSDSLIGYWRFDGNLLDSSGKENDIVSGGTN